MTGDFYKIIIIESGSGYITSADKTFLCDSDCVYIGSRYDSVFVYGKCEYKIIPFEYDGQIDENAVGGAYRLSGFAKTLASEMLSEDGDKLNLMALLLINYCTDDIRLESDSDTLIARALEIMSDSITKRPNLDDISEKLKVSASTLKRAFLQYTGIGVHEYFLSYKISRAKELLKSGVSVTGTANLTGFNNQNYFSSSFKRETGVTPKEYLGQRKQTERKADMPSYLL